MEIDMGPTIEELKDIRKNWEIQLAKLARLPRKDCKELQAIRDGRIQYAIERVRDAHVAVRELEAELEASKNKLARHGIMFG